MGAPELVAIALTIAFTAVVLLGSAVITLLSFALTAGIVYVVFKRISQGGATLVVSSPLAAALAGAAAQSLPDDRGTYIKRCQCRVCGAAKATPSAHAYVYCDYCGELIDFDFQAAISDRRSKLPGPAYEALVKRHSAELERARAARDHDRYNALQLQIYDAYAEHCPAAHSPRIGDPAYRKRFVAYSATSSTLIELDDSTRATLAAQQAAVSGLTWDRSRLGSPRVEGASFWALIDAVVAHQAASLDLIERHDLLDQHPDRPSRDIVRRIGTSLLVQGWLPYVDKADAERLLDVTEMRDDYAHLPPPDLTRGDCPACSAPIEVVEGARRVVCYACGHMVGVGGGELRCHGCATPMVVPESSNAFSCESCDVELKMMRWPA